jgi:hypothetical protein
LLNLNTLHWSAATYFTSFDMAALATSHLITTTRAGFTTADRSAFRRGGFLTTPTRPPAAADALTMRTGAARQARGTQRPGGRRLPSHVVRAASTGGMNVVFVGAEMAPWSKTGGLGDVLGGLPPAMAVRHDTLFFCFVLPSFVSSVQCPRRVLATPASHVAVVRPAGVHV